MNATIPMLLIVATVALAPQSAAQETNQRKEPGAGVRSGSRVPVDISLQGLGDVSGLALGDAARGGRFSVTPSVGSVSPLAFSCAPSIRDQATGSCLEASSVPTPGLLFPPPHDGGFNNVSSGQYSFVGGGENNQATGQWSTVGAGRNNVASGQYSFVGGGENNQATTLRSTVSGGLNNRTFGRGTFTSVGGGRNNTLSGLAATVGGGSGNTASGDFTTVGGGKGNTASGRYATVGGGLSNTARGYFSFAAGRFADANHDGAFVWGDSQSLGYATSKPSSAPDEFNVYCSGGARFFTNSAATTGVLLAPGGGSWSAVSDRASKENVEPVDGRAILAQVVSMPLATWNYKAQDDSIRHMGPMAQDFHAAFGLGVSDKLIDTIDPDGVALAAIQGLHALVQEKDAEIAELREQVKGDLAALEAQIAALTDRLEDQIASR